MKTQKTSVVHDEPVHVVFASDENFVLQLEVAVKSLIQACAGTSVAVHVLDCEIRDETWRSLSDRFRSFAQQTRTDLSLARHVISLDEFSSFRTWNASRAAYARLLIPTCLRGVRFCIYSDCDVLFLKNPCELVDQLRASGKMIAGHCNPPSVDGRNVDFEWLDLVNEPYVQDTYYCSGLVAMDLDQFRDLKMMDRVLAFLSRHPDSVSADQSALNSTCRDHAGLISGNWGLFPHECYGVEGDICAIHYSGGFPWRRASWYEYVLYRRVDRIWQEFCKHVTGVDVLRSVRTWKVVFVGQLMELGTRVFLALQIIPPSKRAYFALMRKVLYEFATLDRTSLLSSGRPHREASAWLSVHPV